MNKTDLISNYLGLQLQNLETPHFNHNDIRETTLMLHKSISNKWQRQTTHNSNYTSAWQIECVHFQIKLNSKWLQNFESLVPVK